MWTQLRLDYLKESVIAAQVGLAKGMFKHANGAVTKLGLWIERKSRRVEAAMSQDLVAVGTVIQRTLMKRRFRLQ